MNELKTVTNYQKMDYLKATLNEGMRIKPVGPVIIRKSVDDDEI